MNPPLSAIGIRVTDHRYGNGAIGASIVTVATEIFITACAIRMRRPGVMNVATVIYCLRCVAAAAVMAVPLALLHDANIGVKIAVGCVTYSLLSVVVGTVTPSGAREALAEKRSKRQGKMSSEVAGEAGEPATHAIEDSVGES